MTLEEIASQTADVVLGVVGKGLPEVPERKTRYLMVPFREGHEESAIHALKRSVEKFNLRRFVPLPTPVVSDGVKFHVLHRDGVFVRVLSQYDLASDARVFRIDLWGSEA